ncbi:hypothetical protein LTR91_006879 [Friedmanniomyces endolithicus]|uniref:Uncharacterized protein n=1 Tax=Friedmanniomyces endolithicus TaxID=329885 RepID=A0AAN6FPV0_9PEZI|nr:hypothetical protein LTR82_007989 [Friedmanniomyces endolithicus]KAK0907060.1 hypothetical protein LTR57_017471 [Friedmanniomyces endolithicus]KAK0984194.1 hypothetical protein LTR54_014095 [Friedmanniomyces endolithicus]KAK0994748.1 hypothetical protein LTS01_006996 [Friedmanniomyces endolithicus]KAK0996667.1 hypothetical protein LTR91_006879 [Friedmanniomyces endolithicus]
MTSEVPKETEPAAVKASLEDVFLRMGFLKHAPQFHAFHNLAWKFMQAQAASLKVETAQLDESILLPLVDAFMEKHEQRLWPRALDKASLLKHLNHPGGDCAQGHHGKTKRVVCYDIAGRYQMAHDEWRQDMMETGSGIAEDVALAGLLTEFFEVVKGSGDPETELGEAELVRCVLAGKEYGGDGKSAEGLPEVDEDERKLEEAMRVEDRSEQ